LFTAGKVCNKPGDEADEENKKQAVRSKWENANPLCHPGPRSGISYKTDPETDPETSSG
jgi:hypothetical protein